MKKAIDGQISLFDIPEKENSTKNKRKKKLTKKKLEEYSQIVLSLYDLIHVGKIIRSCQISAIEAEQVLEYMEEKEYTKNHKKLNAKKNWN